MYFLVYQRNKATVTDFSWIQKLLSNEKARHITPDTQTDSVNISV